MSVASIAGVETPYLLYNDRIIYFLETTTGSAEENDFCKDILGDKESVKVEYVVIPGVGRGADYTGIDVKGKIALVRRGSNTFEEKAIIAQEQGAIGIIIYNNVSGDIKMNVGDATLAACSISQDDGEFLAQGNGSFTIALSQTSGPFISDFSSWGPTPDLRIKPEITAHGGSILSSVTGGSYDRLSGTSMACPNLSGVVVLLRQYVVENFPEIANNNKQVTELVYSLLMSTADIAFGKNGLPYSVRKQGAGLANLTDSLKTPAYIITYNADGTPMDKSKLELGDDPKKSGIYEMKFSIKNFGKDKVSYNIGSYVMTEGVSETKTNAGETTVTEESYILDGATLEVVNVEQGNANGKTVSVNAGETATVTIKVTLSDKDKEYLNKSFANGMYVEGFITLTAESGTEIDMNVPFLAYYGDWTVAPLFDLTYYDTNADELDDGIDIEDKVMADAYPTRPVGGISEDYVSYLGSYYFLQDPKDMVIAANENFVALSNQEGSIHSLRFVWAGMLRNARKIDISITNATTGEVIFSKTENNVRKSYSDGGPSIYPSNIKIEFDAKDYNLANNSKYIVKLVGHVDYKDGGLNTNLNNVFEFPLTIDFEAPTVTGVEYYYKYDKTLKKNRLYADVLIYDNHYTMSAQFGYVTTEEDVQGNLTPAIKTFEQYMTPVYSQNNSTTRVTYELTDYVYDIKNYATNKNSFVVSVYDYALNYATFEIGLPDDFVDFYFEGLESGLTLSPNEVFSLEPVVTPNTEWFELLNFASSKPSVVRVVNNKLVAIAEGSAIIKTQHPVTNESVSFKVTVLGEDDEGYKRLDKPVADVFTLDGYKTLKAYYILDNNNKKLGDTGSVNHFEGNYRLEMYPSESVLLNYSLDSYFPKETTLSFESSNEKIVTVDQNGVVTAVGEGFASVTVKVLMDGKSTYYSETVSVQVNDPYLNTGSSLTHYYGNGGLVDIPKKLKLTEIGQFAFSNFEYIPKTPEELAFDDAESSKAWFIGDNTITKVIIPEGVEKINSYAFANLTALEEIVLPSTLESIEYGAFYNCTSLKKITFSGENNLKIISKSAFEGCNLSGDLELPSICVISDYAFAANKNLKKITLGKTLISVGQYAFARCEALANVDVQSTNVKYGGYAFTACKALSEFTVNSAVIPEGMFYECESLSAVTVGADVKDIGAYAFRDTKVSVFNIAQGNKAYLQQNANFIISADSSVLVAVAPVFNGEFTANSIGNGNKVTKIGKGAFSHNQSITSIVMPNVTEIDNYGLSSNKSLASVSFGDLKAIGDYAFFEASITALPNMTSDVKMGKYAFSHTKLNAVTIPNGMVIPEGAFSECTDLATVVIGNDVTIGKYAFSLNKDIAFKVYGTEENGKKLYKYEFTSPLTSLTIGDNAIIGESAFSNAAKLESVTLGANAVLEKMAFYNASSLKFIDLSNVKSIGDYALSGDVYYACLDQDMTVPAVSSTGYYIYTYHAPMLQSINVAKAERIGEYAFAYCRDLVDVKLNANITKIPVYAFAGCVGLKNFDASYVTEIGEYAFMESGLEAIDLSNVTEIGKYAFVNNSLLTSVTLNNKNVNVREGAFAYAKLLSNVTNLNKAEVIGDYAFAYTAITNADLSNATEIGSGAFIKETVTEFKVTLGNKLNKLGNNPFAMTKLNAFASEATEDQANANNFQISDKVFVIDGSLYYKNVNGLELITYAGDSREVDVAEDTVRISAMAFAGSGVQRVKLPYTVTSIGHKAFFDCKNLELVVFGSYTAPIFEEEFDPKYYETLDHIPGTGDYGTYTDYDGNEVDINGTGMIPYYMWNATGGMYTNVFYGANFVDYVGYVEDKLIMVKPVNGIGYDSYIVGQYFDYTIDGPSAPDNVTIAAINAIKAIPERVLLEHKAVVEAARAAYSKIASLEQQALVTNYSTLITAEQRILALESAVEATTDQVQEEEVKSNNTVIVISIAVIVVAAIGIVVVYIKKRNGGKPVKDEYLENIQTPNEEPSVPEEPQEPQKTEENGEQNETEE